CARLDPIEPELRQIELVNKGIDRAYRIIFANPVFQALRKQRPLATIPALNEAPHPMLPRISSRESHTTAFSHSQGHERRTRSGRSSGACLLRSNGTAEPSHSNPPLSADIGAKGFFCTDNQKILRHTRGPHFKGTPVET